MLLKNEHPNHLGFLFYSIFQICNFAYIENQIKMTSQKRSNYNRVVITLTNASFALTDTLSIPQYVNVIFQSIRMRLTFSLSLLVYG